MSLNKKQFSDLIAKTLGQFDPALLNPQAVDLLLGTAAVESDFGTYLRQIDGGPALGFFMMEPGTFRSLQKTFGAKYPEIRRWRHQNQESNIRQMIVMARLKYRENSEPLPEAGKIGDQATYWKKWYNTPKGAGTFSDYVRKYKRYLVDA